jgi:hypothetical protein
MALLNIFIFAKQWKFRINSLQILSWLANGLRLKPVAASRIALLLVHWSKRVAVIEASRNLSEHFSRYIHVTPVTTNSIPLKLHYQKTLSVDLKKNFILLKFCCWNISQLVKVLIFAPINAIGMYHVLYWHEEPSSIFWHKHFETHVDFQSILVTIPNKIHRFCFKGMFNVYLLFCIHE